MMDDSKWEEIFDSLYIKEVDRVKATREEGKLKIGLFKELLDKDKHDCDKIENDQSITGRAARQYIHKLEEIDKMSNEILNRLKEELEHKTRELENLKQKFYESERQCQFYQKAREDAERRVFCLQAEVIPSYCTNVSPASSITSYRIPSPPPVEIPSVHEILTSSQSGIENFYNGNMTKSHPLSDSVSYHGQSQYAFIQ